MTGVRDPKKSALPVAESPVVPLDGSRGDTGVDLGWFRWGVDRYDVPCFLPVDRCLFLKDESPAGLFLDLLLRTGVSSRISLCASFFLTTTNASTDEVDDDPCEVEEAERREDGEEGGEEREDVVEDARDEMEEVDSE